MNGGMVEYRTMENTIYIIEDDFAIRDELTQLLELQGFHVTSFKGTDFADAGSDAISLAPDCVILDLNLPNTNGLAICRQIKEATSIPIIIVTSSDREFDEVMGMNLGADDYIRKPYSAAILTAHINSVLRRHSQNAASRGVSFNGVTLNLSNGTLAFDGRCAELTRNEQRILETLMRQPGETVTRQKLMSELWDSDEFIDDNTLTVNVSRLREKLASLGVDEGYLATRRGLGYCLKNSAPNNGNRTGSFNGASRQTP